MKEPKPKGVTFWVILLIVVAFISYYVGQSKVGSSNNIDKTPYNFTDSNSGNLVEAYGTFVVKNKSGLTLDGKNDPTGVNGHTVDIICFKPNMTCEQRQAFIGPNRAKGTNYITIGNTVNFDIDQWTDNLIISKPLAIDACTSDLLTIDRVSKTATILNTLSTTNGSCASLPLDQVILTVQ